MEQTLIEAGTVLGSRKGFSLAIPRRKSQGIGHVIVRPDSADLIRDVIIEPLQVYADDRGFFTELARLGSGTLGARMIPDAGRRIQVSATLTYPGAIKAIHYHFEQTDLWAPVTGMLQVFLCDLRCGSASFGQVNTLYVGSSRPWEILIPPGVGHGYKVLGVEPAQLIYLTDRYYNPQDEGRIQYNHPDIRYDWELQHK